MITYNRCRFLSLQIHKSPNLRLQNSWQPNSWSVQSNRAMLDNIRPHLLLQWLYLRKLEDLLCPNLNSTIESGSRLKIGVKIRKIRVKTWKDEFWGQNMKAMTVRVIESQIIVTALLNHKLAKKVAIKAIMKIKQMLKASNYRSLFREISLKWNSSRPWWDRVLRMWLGAIWEVKIISCKREIQTN